MSKINVLLVEDDKFVQHAFCLAFEMHGMNVRTADNGLNLATVENLREVDVVVTDIVMPEVEGLDLIQRIRALSKSIPIIAISGGGRKKDDAYLLNARRFGADAAFQKPVNEEELVDKIKMLVL
ncbi:response regulator [Nisaea sp.]|uniref:response regulator n=1 Tax=Nisaea sp. TaxID=2024842 RepID=UPI0032EEF0CF